MRLPIPEGYSRPSSHTGARLAAILALAGLTVACSGDSVRGAAPQGSAGIPVKVETAKLISVRDTTEYVATLKSRDSAVIMPQVEGQITAIYVRSGTRVSQGTSLMQIDPPNSGTGMGAERVRTQPGSYDAKVVSKHPLDQTKSARDQAQSQLQALQAQVGQETVRLHY